MSAAGRGTVSTKQQSAACEGEMFKAASLVEVQSTVSEDESKYTLARTESLVSDVLSFYDALDGEETSPPPPDGVTPGGIMSDPNTTSESNFKSARSALLSQSSPDHHPDDDATLMRYV